MNKKLMVIIVLIIIEIVFVGWFFLFPCIGCYSCYPHQNIVKAMEIFACVVSLLTLIVCFFMVLINKEAKVGLIILVFSIIIPALVLYASNEIHKSDTNKGLETNCMENQWHTIE